ncbi:unnamed protein product [Sphagnum troendelagicum]|uniref:PGG domain-containing protein n=1 Tax=Sphagnum troendelagicum TaxID=128251 RepID=A0ABP0UCF1_9BRYO
MSSNSQETCTDACLLAIPSNAETTFFLAEKQLLQAICDDACEADLRAYLDYTLWNITVGANEEQRDFSRESGRSGNARFGPESPDMLARGRVYEKALGEARHNTRIEKFLVMEVEKDANLTDYLSLKLRTVRRLKLACWAATCNFVHMVMILTHCRNEGDREFFYRILTIAVEFGYVELAQRLTELEEFDVNRGRRIMDFGDIHSRGVWYGMPRTFQSGCLFYYALSDRLTPLNLAARLGNLEMVNAFLAGMKLDGALSPAGYWALYWVEEMSHSEVSNAILLKKDLNAAVLMTVEKKLILHKLKYGLDKPFDLFDGSDLGPFCEVSLTPLQSALLYGHTRIVNRLKRHVEATIECDTGAATRQIAEEMKRDEIVKILNAIPEVEKDVKTMARDRQVYVDAANTILVVAALISGVTFAGWLQPPLGYSPFFGSGNLDVGAPTPAGMYPSFISVEGHPNIKVFLVFNSLAFFFAISTLVVGAAAARPPKYDRIMEEDMPDLRLLIREAYLWLSLSVVCVTGAFASAGLVVLPPIHSYTTAMIATVVVGVFVTIPRLLIHIFVEDFIVLGSMAMAGYYWLLKLYFRYVFKALSCYIEWAMNLWNSVRSDYD